MDEQTARKILEGSIQEDDSLSNLGWVVFWLPGSRHVTLDAEFTVIELEAIAWWMRNKREDAASPLIEPEVDARGDISVAISGLRVKQGDKWEKLI